MLVGWLVGTGEDAWASPGVADAGSYSLLEDIVYGVVGGNNGACSPAS